MTYEEAIEILQEERDYAQFSKYVKEAIKIAISAIEKRIPCKLAPKSSKKAELPVCGKCNSIMDLMQGELNYCPNCGQKIDWGDEKGGE